MAEADQEVPVVVAYCSVCLMPFEYCEYSKTYKKCKKAHPDMHEVPEEGDGGDDGEVKKTQKRGGKANASKQPKTTKAVSGDGIVRVALVQRQKRKFITEITGLAALTGQALKQCSKKFSGKLAAAATANAKEDKISIQGDHMDEIKGILLDNWADKFDNPKKQIAFSQPA